MEKILIISNSKYPDGNAGAVRQHTFAKLFTLCGYSPFIIGMGESTDFKTREYEGVSYVSFRNKKSNLIHRVLNYFFFKSNVKKFLRNNKGFSSIMVVNIPFNALFYIKKYAKKNNIQLLHDSVEWYSPEQFSLGIFSRSYILKNAYNTLWIDDNFKVISISKYLQNHYQSRNIETIRIPVIMDVESIPYDKRTNFEKIVFLYAGTVGQKDYLKEIIESFSLLTVEELKQVEFRILGVNYDQVKKELGITSEKLTKLGSSLQCYGRVPRKAVLSNLVETDFTVLLRPSTLRYAKAGFPTKVVESLASATPVISNITSDLNEYLDDRVNSIIAVDSSVEGFRDALRNAIKLSPRERERMQFEARKTAEKYFNYYNYIEEAKKLLYSHNDTKS